MEGDGDSSRVADVLLPGNTVNVNLPPVRGQGPTHMRGVAGDSPQADGVKYLYRMMIYAMNFMYRCVHL